MLLPSIVLVGIFVYGFIGMTAWTSLTDSNALQQLSGLPQISWGSKITTELFTGVLKSRFRIDMVNTVFFTVLFIAVCLAVGILLAILLDQKIKGESVFRTIFLFPMALSFVVTGVDLEMAVQPEQRHQSSADIHRIARWEIHWFVSEERWLDFNWQDVPAIRHGGTRDRDFCRAACCGRNTVRWRRRCGRRWRCCCWRGFRSAARAASGLVAAGNDGFQCAR